MNDDILKFLEVDISKRVRGIAAVLVVLGHSVPYVINIFIPGAFFVGLFFFYSGYGVMKKYYGRVLNGFIEKRFIKLWIPYIFAQLIFLVLVNGLFMQQNLKFKDILLCLFGFKLANTSLWYIFEIMLFYIIFYIKYHLIPNVNDYLFWGTSYVAFIIFVQVFNMGLYSWQATHCLYLGLFVAKMENTNTYKRISSKAILYGSCLFYVAYLFFVFISFRIYFCQKINKSVGILPYIKTFVTMLTCILFIFWVAHIIEKRHGLIKGKIVGFLSEISLEVYLYHFIFVRILEPDEPNIICAGLIVVLTIITAEVMHNIHRKVLKC